MKNYDLQRLVSRHLAPACRLRSLSNRSERMFVHSHIQLGRCKWASCQELRIYPLMLHIRREPPDSCTDPPDPACSERAVKHLVRFGKTKMMWRAQLGPSKVCGLKARLPTSTRSTTSLHCAKWRPKALEELTIYSIKNHHHRPPTINSSGVLVLCLPTPTMPLKNTTRTARRLQK